MKANRTIQFGYKIELGILKIEEKEKDIVIEIFNRYSKGESYRAIAEWLTESKIEYITNKTTWSKNIVARILENQDYIGNEKYPSIISKEDYMRASINKKEHKSSESDDIKTIKPILICATCGAHLKRRLKNSGKERWYCPNDNKHIGLSVNDKTLIESIFELQLKLPNQKIKFDDKENDLNNATTIKLNNQINELMLSDQTDFEELEKYIYNLAEKRYLNIEDSNKYNGNLQKRLSNISKEKFESTEIKNVVKEILISNTQAIALILKNGQRV